jgi:hypothetical protein
MSSPTEGEPVLNEPLPEPRGKKLTCEFCESVLFGTGEVKALSSLAKKYRDSEQSAESLRATLKSQTQTIESLEAEIADLKEKLAALPPSPVPESDLHPKPKRGFFSSGAA